MQDLKNELNQDKNKFERSRANGKINPPSLTEFVKFLDPFKELHSECFHLCEIAVVLLVSSHGCEAVTGASQP